MGQGEARKTCCRRAGFGIELGNRHLSNTARLRHVEWAMVYLIAKARRTHLCFLRSKLIVYMRYFWVWTGSGRFVILQVWH